MMETQINKYIYIYTFALHIFILVELVFDLRKGSKVKRASCELKVVFFF